MTNSNLEVEVSDLITPENIEEIAKWCNGLALKALPGIAILEDTIPKGIALLGDQIVKYPNNTFEIV